MTITMNDTLIIKGGKVFDTETGNFNTLDILMEDGRISRIEKSIAPAADTWVINAEGCIVTPGFIDMHCHLREPGYEDKETIASGTMAAAAGGYTVVLAMPNTLPVCDSQTGVKFVMDRAATVGKIRVLPVAAVTHGQEGERITDYGDLISHGAVAFSDDGNPVQNCEVLRRALEYTSMFNVPILDHCEDINLTGDGMMFEGLISTMVGLKGIPEAAESSIVARDLELAEFSGGWLHICHVSVERSVEIIRQAKKRGVKVTAEVTPHHLTLTDKAVKDSQYDPNTKMKPPLASETDRQALIKGLIDGSIDVIATDHAPHTTVDKDQPYIEAPFGVIGLETAFSVLYTELVKPAILPLEMLIRKMTSAPARLMKLNDRGNLKLGFIADVAVINLDKEWNVSAGNIYSRSHNSPFIGKKLYGVVELTVSEGRIAFSRK